MRAIRPSLIAFILILGLSCSLNLYAQKFTLGGGVNWIWSGKNNDAGVGLAAFGEYRCFPNYSLRLNYNYNIASMYGVYGGEGYTMPGYEASVLYYPFNFAIEPHIGAGAGYYNPSIPKPHRLVDTPNGAINRNEISNGVGFHTIAGLKISANTLFSVNFEFKYVFLKLNAKHYYFIVNSSQPFFEDEVDLNTPIVNISLLLNL